MIKAILTDIEGTTSSISFVHDVLFPYAYEKMSDFITQYWDNDRIKKSILEVVKLEKLTDYNPSQIIDILRNWICEYLENSNLLFQESVKDIAHLADRALVKQLHIIEQNIDQEKEFWQNFDVTKDQVNLIFEELQKSLN